MALMCFSTAEVDNFSSAAIPGFVRPRAIPDSTSRSRSFRRRTGDEVRRVLARDGDRGDPLHRYYTPGVAPNVGNPSVSPSYQNPAVDSGLLFPGTGRN